MIPSVELQRSVYARLKSGTYKVYDQFQLGTPMPFIAIGEETLLDVSTKVEKITSHLITVHTWSKSVSTQEVKEMNHFVKTSLIDTPLNVGGFVVLLGSLSLNQTLKEQDGDSMVYHGVTQIEYRLQEV